MSALKFTDIDYFVFTDAARHLSRGQSPYQRDTYRYTPLLAGLLIPTTWSESCFNFGKVLFAVGDIVTGWLILNILRSAYKMRPERALRYSSLWLLNPMVATISTRGSSEGVLAVTIMALLWATLNQKHTLAGFFLGFAVHFKIFPFIYAASISWWLFNNCGMDHTSSAKGEVPHLRDVLSPAQIKLTLTSVITFAWLNISMYLMFVLRITIPK